MTFFFFFLKKKKKIKKQPKTDIDNPIYNLINVAQTTMRSEIGRLSLDKLFEERSQV